MNKRKLTRAIAIIVLIILAVKLNFFSVLFALVFLGIIPGTNLSIPPAIMMICYPVAIIAVLFWLAHQPLYIGSQQKQDKTARAVARKRVAKKTATVRRRYRAATSAR